MILLQISKIGFDSVQYGLPDFESCLWIILGASKKLESPRFVIEAIGSTTLKEIVCESIKSLRDAFCRLESIKKHKIEKLVVKIKN
jgi:hypothetical protein